MVWVYSIAQSEVESYSFPLVYLYQGIFFIPNVKNNRVYWCSTNIIDVSSGTLYEDLTL